MSANRVTEVEQVWAPKPIRCSSFLYFCWNFSFFFLYIFVLYFFLFWLLSEVILISSPSRNEPKRRSKSCFPSSEALFPSHSDRQARKRHEEMEDLGVHARKGGAIPTDHASHPRSKEPSFAAAPLGCPSLRGSYRESLATTVSMPHAECAFNF